MTETTVHLPRDAELGIVNLNGREPSVASKLQVHRRFLTDGRKYAHPFSEAKEAEKRLRSEAEPKFDEFLVIRYRATNEEPYPFEWVDYGQTFNDYGAILTRISRSYDQRFGA